MQNTSRTANKILDIMEIFLKKDGGLSLSEISRLTGLNVATAFRLVSTLAARGYLLKEAERGAYSLGLKFTDYSYAIRKELKFIDFAYLSLSKLSKALNESSYLSVLDADTALVIEEVGVTEDQRINSPVGKRLALHNTACGKILLAHLSKEERKAYYSRKVLEPFTQHTITDVQRLEKELVAIKKQGVAFDEEEYRIGIWATAAPVYNGSGKIIAAAGLLVITSHLVPGSTKKFTTAIKSCAAEISQIISRIT
jgi:DNA-binding IclR family transcriptional regulator